MKGKQKILIYGYGNPGRRDDGLGPAFIHLVEAWKKREKTSHIATDSNYQLNIEEALTIRDYEKVIFVDASMEEINDFQMIPVLPSEKVSFTMHAVNPSFILDLCRKLYGRSPDVFLLKIKGYDFELAEGLTDRAASNLLKAFSYLKKNIIYHPEKILKGISA
jgi:hydrogenase maturation protease